MGTALAENIRRYRKERKLTQEQLSEVLGVTTGAVYKWEAGLSVPELDMLVSLADFFDSSVDALLGHRMNESSLKASLENIGQLTQSRDPEAITQTEVMLSKYPNTFEAVMNAASVYQIYGNGSRDEKRLRRSQELLEHALVLLPQNTDPQIGEQTICGIMAGAYILLGEEEKGVELLKQHNTDGVFNDLIGLELAFSLNRPAEAEPYLSDALLLSVSSLFNTVLGFVAVFSARGDHRSAEEITAWSLEIIRGIKKEAATDFLDKAHAVALAMLACTQMNIGKKAEAYSSLEEAAALARRFDAGPDYSMRSMRYMAEPEQARVYDTLGATASESIGKILENLGSEELHTLWKEAESHA